MKLVTTLLLCLSIGFSLQAQVARVMIDGQIIVPAGDDVAGIVVYNKTAQRGTITSEEGTFDIAVARNDEVVIQSVQFAPITVVVDQGVVSSKQMNVTLRETVNVLDEIIVTPYDLTGDIVADVNRVRTVDPVPFDGSDIRIEDSQYDKNSPADNIAIDDQRWRYGLNFVNIFKAIFQKSDGEEEEAAEDELAEMYSNKFFQNNLDIKKEHIGLYMDYVAANGLTKEMLEQGNELALIQFLIDKREDFKKELAASK
ncbi:MAG: hypothetical protein VX226_09040 [Bacteroidota bacterium]|nr:hypothetical protein [Bacteroidota bacterium]MEE3244787.1 hypothetical protein [Bacteroidota bacterium]